MRTDEAAAAAVDAALEEGTGFSGADIALFPITVREVRLAIRDPARPPPSAERIDYHRDRPH
ncbi:MAG: hypothetical protein FWG25_08615, partial [Promicromonosporaceae bacterium]|nr:hypothetical protein [Promicromonosporaceae bacterium]